MNGMPIMTGIIATQGNRLHLSCHKVLPAGCFFGVRLGQVDGNGHGGVGSIFWGIKTNGPKE